ncbi:MAG: glycosyltransferase, partial [Ignavibacteria bacterium]|nr:glycosyltransferase [Ignavibacteria bacterium]
MISIGLKSLEIFENPNIPSISIDEPIEIIIPVYNAYQLLKNCLESIWKNTTLQYRLIVVDDNSNDNNVRKLLNEFQKRYSPNNFILIHNETNIGFVKSVNKAAKIVKNHFVVLNTDTEVPPNWLERLIYPILKFDKIASVTPFTNAGTICSFPEFLKDNELFLGLTTGQIDHYFQYIDIDKNLIEIPTGVGFCMAFNKEVYDKIGLFDEVFGKGYGEENDWCMRAKKIGYKNVIATNLFVYHKHGSSFSSEEKRILLERNMKILLQKHPDYSFLVDEFIKKDPLKEIRLFVQSKILSTKNDPILIIDHMLGGGANEFSKTLINKSPFTLYLTFNFKENIYQISLITNQEEIFQTKLKTFYDLESFIKMFEIQKIYINELVSYPFVMEIIDFLVELYYKYQEKIKYYLYIHDFFVICPNFNLITYYNNIYKYCGIPNDFGFCNQCLKKNLIFFYLNPFIIYCNKNLSIEEWRSKFSRFLNIAFKIIVFSNNSKGILLKAYPNLDEGKIEVVPHSVSWVRQAIVKKTNSTINIGIIGNITVHKGNLVIISLCDFIKKFELDIKVHVFGDFDKMKFDIRKYDNLILHGQYNKSFLPELMEKFEIDIIFIPSIWPETFSYTTEEAIKMGLPVAVFNIGAPAERVKNYEKGLILDKNDPEYIISSILKFLNSINEEKYKNISFENIPTSKERNISIVFFSKDRPMQLDAALRTFLINCKINQKAHKYVLYKVSENKYEKEYDLLKSNFPSVIFVREKDFKNDLLNLIKGTDYIFFSVDDSIYTNNFSLEKILRLLDQDSSVLGFSLRLGKNTNYCYPLDKFQNLPNFEPIENKILKFNWTISEYDFGYPLEVSSSIYRTKDLLPILENSFFTNPNTLESLLDNQKNIFASSKPYLLCFETSFAFSNPLNLVQTAWKNRASEKEKYSKENLLDLFSKGFRINTDKFQGFVSNSPHQEVDIEFININKKDNPLVSVIIPCYNQAEFLPEAVESVVNQTFQDWEC